MQSLRYLSKIEIHRRSMQIVRVSNTSRYKDNNEKNWKEYLETMPREILMDLYNDIRNHSSEYLHAIWLAKGTAKFQITLITTGKKE